MKAKYFSFPKLC